MFLGIFGSSSQRKFSARAYAHAGIAGRASAEPKQGKIFPKPLHPWDLAPCQGFAMLKQQRQLSASRLQVVACRCLLFSPNSLAITYASSSHRGKIERKDQGCADTDSVDPPMVELRAGRLRRERTR